MSEFGSDDLQNSATAGLASLSDRPATSSVSRFSGKLSVDEELKLSNETFNETIFDFFKDKDITPLSQLKTTPPFPTPHVLVQFVSKAHTDYKTEETDAHYETRLELPDGWKLLTTACNNSKTNGYFGAAYWHPEHQQVVIAHRGTDPTNLGALWADLKGMLRNQYVQQMESASTFANKVVEVLREVKREKGISFQLFLTGHAVGGWIAQVTTFTTENLKKESKFFLKSNNDLDCFHPHTVVFDTPGCKDMLLKLRNTYLACLDERSNDLEHLDITSYLSAPNRINTCNTHVGTVYRIFPDLSDMGWWEKLTHYEKAKHIRKKIVETFDPETGQVYRDEQGHLKVQVVVDWPVCANVKRDEECKELFEWTNHLSNCHPDTKDVSFQFSNRNPIRYQTKVYDERENNLSTFSEEEQEFLRCYRWLRQWPEFLNLKELFSPMRDRQAQKDAVKKLRSFEIENETIHCTDPSTLKTLIPYVKRLLQLFPEIKEIGNRVWLCETYSCIEQINQSALDFNPDASNVRTFLENEQQQVLQLQIVDGDEWTGLIKVYQVLQKTDCLIKGQYTILTLERLLSLNMLVTFRTLMQSIKIPHRILVACEANQLLKAETKDMIRTFFEAIKEKACIKVILTTRLEDKVAHFLQHTGREIFGNGFVTRVEKLNWRDLTSSSQEKLLEKPVIFQDAKITLNELMFAESPVATFLPLGALLEENVLQIADPMPFSNGYNETYYIGRTLRHQVAVKQETYSDNDVKEKRVFLASTEQEFKHLCQLYSNSNVHWLEKDNSGNLVWQQSQGSLESLRRYIDTESSQTYTADDLEKLLEKAQHQRVLLISDTAGMGKSTVLTYLSKQIKQNFPAKWVVRIDLNDHTDALRALKQEEIDKDKAIEFVSEKLLNLKPGLDLELFKQCCEQKQKVRVVIMLDGFNEISPSYKESATDLLQALRQTTVEQLWVTTRPHLRNEMEDKLQQLSYTLEPFSEENQVEFLTKFWSLKDWFIEMNSKEKEESKKKIEIYATKLIKKLGNSINDKDREFTGIPLQTRMLAEAFDEEVMIFCQSAESTPELTFQLDLLGLYGRFIEKKYDIYHEEELQVPVNNVAGIEQRETDLKNMREDHQLLALKVLLTEEQVAQFQNNEQRTFSAEELSRIGIVQVSHDGKPHFIHRTFAEYYVADCLVNRLTEGNNSSEQVQTFILKDIFLREEYQLIRAFIDGLLSRCKLSKQMSKEYRTRIDELGIDNLLHRAELESNVNITEFLSASVRAGGQPDTGSSLVQGQDTEGTTDHYNAAMGGKFSGLEKLLGGSKEKQKKTKYKLLSDTIKQGNTIWHVAADWDNIDELQGVRKWAKENLTTEEIKNNLLLATDSYGNTVWHWATEWGKLDLLQEIWELAEENLTAEEKKDKFLLATDNKGNTAWHLAVEWGQLDIVQQIWELAKEKLTTEELKCKLLLATDRSGNTAWNKAAQLGKLDVLQKIWKLAKQNLTTEEIKNKLLLATENKGNTAWHLAIECGQLESIQKIWEWAKEKLTKKELKRKFLLAIDTDGNTGWHRAVKRGEIEVLEKIWELAKENLTTEEIKNKVLLATNNKGNTPWHVAVEWGKVNILQKIWEWAKEKLTTEELKYKLLLATDRSGNTAWKKAAQFGKLDVLHKIWTLAKKNLTTEEIKNKLLLATENKGNTAWHLAVEWGQLDSLQKIWELAKEKLTTDELKYNLLATDSDGNTGWHRAVKRGELEILHKIWALADEILTREEIKNKFLLATDSDGNTVWHWAAEWGKLDVLQEIWELAKENLTREEINNNLLATDDKGNTAWHLAVEWGHLDIVQKIWEWAKEKLTTEELIYKLLSATDKSGNTAWEKAAQLGKLEVLRKIWEVTKENLTPEEIKNRLLLATDNKGNTAWHLAVEWGQLDILQQIWEWAKEKLTTEELKYKILLAIDSDGNTGWNWAVKRGELQVLQKIWELAKENLTTEEIKNKFLLPTDSDGNTVWHLAAEWGKLDILQKIWEMANEILTTEEIKNKLLLATDNKGNTAWHVAVEWGQIDILQKIWDLAKEKLTTGELKYKMFLATDRSGNTAWPKAEKWGNIDVLLKIWELAKEILTTEEIKNRLLLATDNKGNTAWHLAVGWGKLDILQDVWDWAKEKITTEELKYDLLLATDRSGNTAWHKAAKRGELDILQKIWEWAKENLTTEEIKNNLLLATDSEGNTVLHWAAEWGKLDVLQKIWGLAKENLTREEIKNNLLLAPDNMGNTAWHFGAKCNKLYVVQEIREWAKENLTAEELKNSLLLATDNMENTA